MTQAKLIATVGPACSDVKMIKHLIQQGVDVFRLNFSFGDYSSHQKNIDTIRELSSEAGRPVAILQDLQGPKIRIGILDNDVKVHENDRLVLTGQHEHKQTYYLPTTYAQIAKDAKAGETILLADGKIILDIERVDSEAGEVHCIVKHGGTILSGKGINLPNTEISLPALTEKDVEDAVFGAQAGVDYIALSFVRHQQDVLSLKDLLKEHNTSIPIIGKIEKPEALDNLDEILDVVDGVMVARGDLAVEISFARVPIIQKEIISKANCRGKMTIVATEMLSSMTNNPRPTRAEASDVANALIDGADAVMLSNETAAGEYPLEAVKVMKEIIIETEKSFEYEDVGELCDLPEAETLSGSICAAATFLSYAAHEKGFLVMSESGRSVRLLSKYRPRSPIFAFTFHEKLYNQMALYHNVHPILLTEKQYDDNGHLYYSTIQLKREVLNKNILNKGDKVILLRGTKTGGRWELAHIKIETID